MKTAAEWVNDVGQAAMQSTFCGSNPPGVELEKMIMFIQVEALQWARQEHLDSINAESFDVALTNKIRVLVSPFHV